MSFIAVPMHNGSPPDESCCLLPSSSQFFSAGDGLPFLAGSDGCQQPTATADATTLVQTPILQMQQLCTIQELQQQQEDQFGLQTLPHDTQQLSLTGHHYFSSSEQVHAVSKQEHQQQQADLQRRRRSSDPASVTQQAQSPTASKSSSRFSRYNLFHSISGPIGEAWLLQSKQEEQQQRPSTAPSTVVEPAGEAANDAAIARQLQQEQPHAAAQPQQAWQLSLGDAAAAEDSPRNNVLYRQAVPSMLGPTSTGNVLQDQLPLALDIPAPALSHGASSTKGSCAFTGANAAAVAAAEIGADVLSRQLSRQGSNSGMQALLGRLQVEVVRLTDSNEQLQESLVAAQGSLAEQQHQVADAKGQLDAADKAKGQLQEQVHHLTAKLSQLESQLEFAHRQLDVRAQEARGQTDAVSAAGREAAILQAELNSLKDELLSSRKELDAVTKKMLAEAADARRCSDEAAGLQRQLAQLNSELVKARQEAGEARERARQQQADGSRRTADLEVQVVDLSSQLLGAKEQLRSRQSHIDALQQQLADADSATSSLAAQLAQCQREKKAAEEARDSQAQLQADSSRRAALLQEELGSLSNQLMVLKSQNSRLVQQLLAAESNNDALAMELEAARRAATANLQHTSQLQQQLQEQRHHLELQHHQLERQQQQQYSCIEPAVSGLGLDSNGWVHHQQQQQQQAAAEQPWKLAAVSYSGAERSSFNREAGDFSVRTLQRQQQQQQQLGFPKEPAAASLAAEGQGSYYARYQQQQQQQQQQHHHQVPYSQSLVLGSPLKQERSHYWSSTVPAPSPGAPGSADSSVSPDRNSPQHTFEPQRHKGAVRQLYQQQQQQPSHLPDWYTDPEAKPSFKQAPRLPPSGLWPQQPGQLQHGPYTAAGHEAHTADPRAGAAGAGGWPSSQQQWPVTLPASPSRFSPSPPPPAPAAAAAAGNGSPAPPTAAAPPAAPVVMSSSSPFGTDMTVAEIMAATKQLEDQLLALCQERDELNKELAKLPLGAGRTLRERQRKQAVEQRLEELHSLISRTRMNLKRITR